jgi:hypothetical protein
MATANRVRVTWTGVAGTPYYSNFFSLAGAVAPSVAHAAVAAMLTTLKPLYVTALSALVEGDVAIIDGPTNQTIGVATVAPATIPGSGGASLAPPATQGLVRLLTSSFSGGRQVRGRFSMPGLSSGAITAAGTPTAGYVAGLNAAWATYLTALGPAACVFSRKNGTFVPITAASTWTQFSVLRSRRD